MNRSFRLVPWLAVSLLAGSCGGEAATDGEKTRRSSRLDLVGASKSIDGSADWEIDFGLVFAGGRGAPELYVQNTGTEPLEIRLDEGVHEPFSIDLDSNLVVEVGERRKISIAFQPGKAGTYEALLKLQTNEREKSTRSIRLIGRSAQAAFSCTPESLDLGMVVLGSERTGTTVCRNLTEIPITVELQGLTGPASLFFRAVAAEGDGQRATVEPGGSLAIDVTYAAWVLGRLSASLPIMDENKQTFATVLVEAEAVSGALQMDPTGCLDFGTVNVEGAVTRSLFIRNLSPHEVAVQSFKVVGGHANFGLVSPQPTNPVPLAAEGTEPLEVELVFHPQTAGRHNGVLRIQSDDPLLPELDVCLTGVGGGGRISCTPERLDFGATAIGMSVSRPFQCANSGLKPEPLFVEGASSDNPLFDAEIRNHDGSREPKPRGYAPGESFFVDVTYTPTSESLDNGNILVHSTARATPAFPLFVGGSGRVLPPCRFSVRPPSLRFGNVGPGDQRTLAFYLQSDMENAPCQVSGLRLSDDSDSAFSMEEIASAVLGPTERLAVPVTFAPTEEKRSSGEVQFHVSNPKAEAAQKVSLSGTGARPCLDIHPTELDFMVPPGCSTREQGVSLINNCNGALLLQDLSIDPQTYPWFSLTGAPSLPSTLRPGNRMEFAVSYHPDGSGEHPGAIEVQLKDSNSYVVALKGISQPGATQTDEFIQKDLPKVDVLWVIDNSASMDAYQNIIRQNPPAFLDFALEQGIDFHLGVTTSGLDPVKDGKCPGGVRGGENGRLFPVDNSFPRILHPRMPRQELETAWAHNVQVGVCHGTEPIYEAAKRALSPPVIDNAKVPGTLELNDGNLGFLRPEAALSVIFVHDESDQDSALYGSVEAYVTFYRSLKPSRRGARVKVHAISGGKDWNSPCRASACPRCVEGTELTGGTWVDICIPPSNTEAWGAALEKLSQAAFGFDTAFTLRGQPADKNDDGRWDDQDIEVRVNGRMQPSRSETDATVWRYNHVTNEISFTPPYVPTPGQKVSVTYDVFCG